MQEAAMAVHPALLSEVSRVSFAVCQAYLCLLLGAGDGPEWEAATTGLVHMLRLGGAPTRLTELALRNLCCCA
jgi:hypothetical protein